MKKLKFKSSKILIGGVYYKVQYLFGKDLFNFYKLPETCIFIVFRDTGHELIKLSNLALIGIKPLGAITWVIDKDNPYYKTVRRCLLKRHKRILSRYKRIKIKFVKNNC